MIISSLINLKLKFSNRKTFRKFIERIESEENKLRYGRWKLRKLKSTRKINSYWSVMKKNGN